MTIQTIEVLNIANDDGWTYFGSLQNNTILNAVGDYSGGTGCDIYARFRFLSDIAQGSVINSAIFRQVGWATDSTGPFSALVQVQKIANAPDVISGFDLDGRTYCTVAQSLVTPSVVNGANFDIDLTASFQELADFTDLLTDNYTLIRIMALSGGGINRQFRSRDYGAGNTFLILDYSDPVSGVSNSRHFGSGNGFGGFSHGKGFN